MIAELEHPTLMSHDEFQDGPAGRSSPRPRSPVFAEEPVDTVTLLQEEIERLQAELDAREGLIAALQSGAPGTASPEEDPAADATERLDELTRALAERDETIQLLADQLRAYEEAAEAQQEEWKQLEQWIADLEARFAAQEAEAAATIRDRNATITRLQTPVAQPALASRATPSGPDRGEEPGPSPAALERPEIPTAAQELRQQRDALRQEQAELAVARSELAAERLEIERLRAEPRDLHGEPADPAASEANLRIRALRDQLRETAEQERIERSGRGILSRIAKLWRRTDTSGPPLTGGSR